MPIKCKYLDNRYTKKYYFPKYSIYSANFKKSSIVVIEKLSGEEINGKWGRCWFSKKILRFLNNFKYVNIRGFLENII